MKVSPLSEYDLHLFHEGTNYRAYQILGAHLTRQEERDGVRFAVWAPDAAAVSVVGDFNHWQGGGHAMSRIGDSGVWALFIPDLPVGTVYKYELVTAAGKVLLKADPYAFAAELRPQTGSKVANLQGHHWQDREWRLQRGAVYDKPMNIYEVHLGSWRRNANGDFLTYRELAETLPEYVAAMGYTHVELMPVGEYPFDGSWGYQSVGFYAVTSRYGDPLDFMYLVDRCHQQGIGVILDWVPSHFCKDDHGLRLFDGSPLYEYAVNQRAENWQWGTLNFDLGRPEVMSFLIANAVFWLEFYHIDGLRIDAVANMLYLDYARDPGDWSPNRYGGREDLEGIGFLRRLNKFIFANFPHALVLAEESTSWPLVTKPTYVGGLGFNFKWNMGWMNDMLKYMEMDSIHRKWNHHLVTFSFVYAFSENYVLPMSHDEVVHGKKSLLDKMPGDYWQKFANLRAFYGYMMGHPGKKLLFMGSEFGQFIEWQYGDSLDWHLLEYDMHKKMHDYVKALNHFYRENPALWQVDHDWNGFAWIDCQDFQQSVIVFQRKARKADEFLIVVCNFTPNVHYDYRIGVPAADTYYEAFNSDDPGYGGSGQNNRRELVVEDRAWHNQSHSLRLTLPPLATIFLKPVGVKSPAPSGKASKFCRMIRGPMRKNVCRRLRGSMRGRRRK